MAPGIDFPKYYSRLVRSYQSQVASRSVYYAKLIISNKFEELVVRGWFPEKLVVEFKFPSESCLLKKVNSLIRPCHCLSKTLSTPPNPPSSKVLSVVRGLSTSSAGGSLPVPCHAIRRCMHDCMGASFHDFKLIGNR